MIQLRRRRFTSGRARPTSACLARGPLARPACLPVSRSWRKPIAVPQSWSGVLTGRTIARLDELARTLRAQDWPSPTNKSQILRLRVEIGSDVIQLTTLDYRGDSFSEELRQLSNDQIEELKAAFDNADTFLLVLDPKLDLAPSIKPNPGHVRPY